MKRGFILVIILIVILTMVACNTDSLADYKQAAERTDQIKKGQSSGELSLEIDFNTNGMTEEEIKELNYYKDLKGSFQIMFDDEVEKGIFRNYLSFGGLGFDFDLFINNSEAFIKLPVVGKYMKLDELQSSVGVNADGEAKKEIISESSLNKISQQWVGLMKKEDVFKGKDIVLTTPDGEVKTTVYNIHLNDDQIKTLGEASIDILSQDENFRKTLDDIINNADSFNEKTAEDIMMDLRNNMNNYKIEDFNYTAYVDIDGYIVNEIIEVESTDETAEKGNPTRIVLKMELKNWDINKEQKFEFPVLTEENTVRDGDLEGTLPFMIEDLMENKN